MSDFEIIENYLKGNLKGDELSTFERRLAADSQFSSEVEKHRKVQELILLRGLLETRGKLDEIRRVKSGKHHGTGNNHWGKILLLGISAVLISGLFLWLDKKENKPEKESLTVRIEEKKQSKEDTNSKEESPSLKSGEQKIWKEKSEGKRAPVDSISEKPDNKVVPDPIPTPAANDSSRRVPAVMPKEADQSVEQNPCKLIVIQAKIHSEESCVDKPTGKISLSSITGGSPPYKFSFNNYNFSSKDVFMNIGEGMHQVTIKDSKGCIQSFEIEIPGKECLAEKPSKFSPDLGETWEYPVAPGGNAKVRLYDVAGRIVFETTIVNGYPTVWDGTGNHGSYIKAGAYIYQIINENGTVKEGSVTLVR